MGAVPACILTLVLAAVFLAVFQGVRALAGSAPWHALAHTRRLSRLSSGELREIVVQVPFASRVFERVHARRRARELERGMPEAIRLLCIALDAGSSLVKALEYAARNCDEPLAGELSRVVWDVQAGQGFDEAMEHLRARTGGTEFAYLAVAMEIQHRSGGSLGEVLRSVSSMLRQNAELDRDLRSKTAQARLSARVVACMPVVLLLILTLLTQNYLGLFFSSPLGVLMFASACALELLGIVLVRRGLCVQTGTGARRPA